MGSRVSYDEHGCGCCLRPGIERQDCCTKPKSYMQLIYMSISPDYDSWDTHTVQLNDECTCLSTSNSRLKTPCWFL